MAHHSRVLLTYVRFERSLARWHRLDDHLNGLAVLAAAARVGCAWCMDFGYWTEHTRGLDPAKLQAVPMWRDSEQFTLLERPEILGTASEAEDAVQDGWERWNAADATDVQRGSLVSCARRLGGARRTSVHGCPSRC